MSAVGMLASLVALRRRQQAESQTRRTAAAATSGARRQAHRRARNLRDNVSALKGVYERIRLLLVTMPGFAEAALFEYGEVRFLVEGKAAEELEQAVRRFHEIGYSMYEDCDRLCTYFDEHGLPDDDALTADIEHFSRLLNETMRVAGRDYRSALEVYARAIDRAERLAGELDRTLRERGRAAGAS